SALRNVHTISWHAEAVNPRTVRLPFTRFPGNRRLRSPIQAYDGFPCRNRISRLPLGGYLHRHGTLLHIHGLDLGAAREHVSDLDHSAEPHLQAADEALRSGQLCNVMS